MDGTDQLHSIAGPHCIGRARAGVFAESLKAIALVDLVPAVQDFTLQDQKNRQRASAFPGLPQPSSLFLTARLTRDFPLRLSTSPVSAGVAFVVTKVKKMRTLMSCWCAMISLLPMICRGGRPAYSPSHYS